MKFPCSSLFKCELSHDKLKTKIYREKITCKQKKKNLHVHITIDAVTFDYFAATSTQRVGTVCLNLQQNYLVRIIRFNVLRIDPVNNLTMVEQ